MKILVTRHGQTDWNVEKRIQGRTDIELNNKKIEPFNDNVIYETENFVVAVPKVPHIPRTDGGHL